MLCIARTLHALFRLPKSQALVSLSSKALLPFASTLEQILSKIQINLELIRNK